MKLMLIIELVSVLFDITFLVLLINRTKEMLDIRDYRISARRVCYLS